MRYFVVQDQLKAEIYDINGNVFHSKLRENIEIGMIVGVKVLQKIITKDNKEKDLISSYREYQKIRKKYTKYLEIKQKGLDELIRVIRRKEEEIKTEISDFFSLKQKLEYQMSKLKEKIDLEFEIELKKKIGRNIAKIGNQIKKVEKNTRKKEKVLNLLNNAITNPSFSKSTLISECDIPKTFFVFLSKEYDFLDELSNIWKMKTENKPWEEIIFLKIFKKSNHKLYGEVIDRFRRVNHQSSLKAGDRLSILPKQILYVPALLNKKSKLNSYFKTNYSFKYYQSDHITDWNGVFLNNSILDYIIPGTELRIQLKQNGYENGTTWYVHILEVNSDYLYGELLDYYKLEGLTNNSNLKAGFILKFNRKSIIEIPLVWNSHFKPFSKLRNKDKIGYPITGYRLDSHYVDI